MDKFNPYEQYYMYRMDEEPPEMELNGYIIEYKRTGDGYWLDCYLHRFEKDMLNGWVYKQCEKYGQLSRFKDIKQEMMQAMLEKLGEYDPTVGTTLIQFAGRNMVGVVHTYIRKNVGTFLLSDGYYKNLRKVNAIHYKDSTLSPDTRIQKAIKETGFSQGYIEQGKWFRYPESIESIISDFVQAKLTPDSYSSPDIFVPHNMFMDAYVELIENLRERDRHLLFDYLGIKCLYCGRVGEPIPKVDIADKHQLRDEQSVDNRFRKIVEGLRVELRVQGWF